MARMAILVGLLVGLALSNSALAQEKTKDSPQKEAPKALDRLHELNSMDIQLYEQELRKFIGYIPRSRAA